MPRHAVPCHAMQCSAGHGMTWHGMAWHGQSIRPSTHEVIEASDEEKVKEHASRQKRLLEDCSKHLEAHSWSDR
eukprot:6860415-Lingulodinium_polyedra.AAC.1